MRAFFQWLPGASRRRYRAAESAADTAARTQAGQQIASGMTYHAAGRLHEAESCYCQALALDPRSDAAHNLLGVALQQRGKLSDAHASFTAAVRLNPANWQAQTNLGNAWTEKGDLDRAEACYRS